MMSRVLLAVCAAALLCGGCATDGIGGANAMLKPVKELVNGPGTEGKLIADLKAGPYEKSLLALGEERDLAQSQGRGLGFVRQADLEQYLGRIHARLVAASGVSEVPGKVRILATPGPEAKSTPDGNIFVSMAWLTFLESEDEVASIIAHELAHVLLRHHSTELVSHTERRLETAHQVGIVLRMTAEKATTFSKSDVGAVRNIQLATKLAEQTLLPAWNRRQETEADLLGIDLLQSAGYSPIALADMLAKLEAWQANTQESEAQFQARVSEVARTNLAAALELAVSKLWDDLGSNHPDTGKRQDDTAAYIDRHYGSVQLSDPTRATWQQLVRRPVVRDVLSGYDLAFSASKLLNKGQAREAYTFGRSAVRKLPTHAYPNWIAAKSAMSLGRSREAVQYMQRAMKSTDPTPDMYRDLVALNESSGKHAEALKWIADAEKRFGDSPDWLPERVRIYRKMGRKDDMSSTLMKCSWAQPHLKRLCEEEAVAPAQRKTSG